MVDQTARIDPIRPRLRWQVLTPDEVERLERAILCTLAEVGVCFPLERALDALERGGCRVDRATQVARLPEDVVRAALQAAPTAPLLAARDPRCDIVLDGSACHLSNDGCGIRVVDPQTGQLRPSTRQDVADSARFVDALPQVSFYWGPVVTAEDVPLATRPLHEAEAVFANTSKHFQAVDVVGEDMTRRVVEMARVVAGGDEELRRRPIMSLIACPIDPLGNEAVSLEAALVCAEAGVPVGFLSLTLACASAPATLAGNLVVNLAAVLAGIVLLQLAYPGAPVFLAGAPSVMDLKTGGYTGGSPEDYVLAAAATQLAHHFDFAMNMELDGKAYYEKLAAETTVGGLKSIFTSLAADEQKHYEIILAIKAGSKFKMADSAVLEKAKNLFEEIIADRNNVVSLKKSLDGYQYARKIEADSVKLYEDMAKKEENPEIVQLLLKIANEEKKHFNVLDNLYDYILAPQNFLVWGEFSNLKEF
jgi:trimethylamine--corrinoid protein Co-methyltransferase